MRDPRLTILQLTHQGDGAGSTQSILNLSEHLARRGHRVLVGCRSESLLARQAADAGLSVVPLDFGRLARLVRALAAVIVRERVSVVNSHATRDRRALTWLRWRGRLPAAFVVTRRTMPLTSPVELWAVGHTGDRTIAVSGAVALALARRGHPTARLRVVPNGVDLARLDAPIPPKDVAAAGAALGDPGGRPVIVCVARRKLQDVLLRAAVMIERPVTVACIGVEQDAELAALAAALPERHHAVFVPFTERPLAFYHLAAVATLPSAIEGLSQGLLEAMALGLPVVASAVGGNPELVIDGRTGFLAPPRDARAWAERLSRLLGDPALADRLGHAGRAMVRQSFTLERTAQRTETVYREAVARCPLLSADDHV
jgi:glycosyltransferase involved in cell wall biosynthesis